MSKSLNKVQSEMLLERMIENKDLANGSSSRETRANLAAFWDDLYQELNSVGPPVKSVGEWKKVWADQKRYMRNKGVKRTSTTTKLKLLGISEKPVMQDPLNIDTPSSNTKRLKTCGKTLTQDALEMELQNQKELCATLSEVVALMKIQNTGIIAGIENIYVALEKSNEIQKEMLVETKRHNLAIEKIKSEKLEQNLCHPLLKLED